MVHDPTGQQELNLQASIELNEGARTDQALRESEEHLSALINQTLSGIAETDANGTFLMVNDHFCTITGYTREELVGQRRMQELTHPDDLLRNLELFARCVSGGIPFEIEKRLLPKGGAPLWVNVSVAAINDANGNPASTVAVVIDIDERKRAEEALRDREERLRLAVEAAEGGSFTIYYDDRQNEADERTLMLFGFKPGEWQGDEESVFARLIPADRIAVQQAIAQAIEQHLPYHSEFRVKLPDGSVRWLIGLGKAEYDVHGRPVLLRGVNLDITDRKQAEEKLRASEERYRQLVEQAVDGIFLADATGRYVDANSAGLQMVGYTLEELRQLTVNELIVPQELPRMPGQFTQLGTGDVVVSEWRFRRKDGSTFMGEVVGRRLPDGRLLGILRDVTARRLIEDALRSSQSMLAAALASMTDAVFISDTEGRFLEFNEAFATFHKFRNKSECAQTLQEYPAFLDVYFPNGEMAPLEQWAVPRALRGESVVNAEYHLYRKDTGESWIGSYNFAPIRDQHNQIVGSVVVGRDITSEKQAQQALHDSQRRMASLFQHAQNAILLADDQAHYLDANPAACLLTGFTREELLQKNVWDLTPIPEKERGLQLWQEFIRAGEQTGEYPLRCKDGAVRIVEFRAVANILPGLHLSILHDISNRKEAEAALQHAHNELEQANALLQAKEQERNRLMRRLITVQEEERQRLSWELHDQTSQHLVALRMMLTTLSDPLPSQPEQRVALAQIQQLAERLGDELHTLAWNLRPARLKDRGLATALAEYVQEWSARSQISADFHCRGNQRRRFPAMLEITIYRVVQEALTNVLKHAKAQQVSVLLEYFPHLLRVVIEDNGVGFAPQLIELDLDGAAHLGLMSMRERLALVDGEMEIESTPGQGTAVYLRIPLPASEPGAGGGEV